MGSITINYYQGANPNRYQAGMEADGNTNAYLALKLIEAMAFELRNSITTVAKEAGYNTIEETPSEWRDKITIGSVLPEETVDQ